MLGERRLRACQWDHTVRAGWARFREEGGSGTASASVAAHTLRCVRARRVRGRASCSLPAPRPHTRRHAHTRTQRSLSARLARVAQPAQQARVRDTPSAGECFFRMGGPRSTAAARPWCRDCLRAPPAPSAPCLSPPTSTLGHPPLCEPPLPASCNVRCETRRPPPPKRTKTRRCRYRDGCGASCRLPRWHLPTTRTPGHGLCCPLPVECRHRGAWGEGRPWAPLLFGCARVVFFWRFFFRWSLAVPRPPRSHRPPPPSRLPHDIGVHTHPQADRHQRTEAGEEAHTRRADPTDSPRRCATTAATPPSPSVPPHTPTTHHTNHEPARL